jgi:Na+-transporting NADH:ubiquinone oxidoreductase subunit NqrF
LVTAAALVLLTGHRLLVDAGGVQVDDDDDGYKRGVQVGVVLAKAVAGAVVRAAGTCGGVAVVLLTGKALQM